jgi:hypothetical protein
VALACAVWLLMSVPLATGLKSSRTQGALLLSIYAIYVHSIASGVIPGF